jgi:hypothetical protein
MWNIRRANCLSSRIIFNICSRETHTQRSIRFIVGNSSIRVLITQLSAVSIRVTVDSKTIIAKNIETSGGIAKIIESGREVEITD